MKKSVEELYNLRSINLEFQGFHTLPDLMPFLSETLK